MSAKFKAPSEWSTADLGAFFVKNRSEFLAHARRVTRSTSEAEEVVQDSLVRVLLACPELTSVDHALSYFHRVIENLSIDLQRRHGRQPRLVVLDDVAGELEAKWSVDPDYAQALATADDAAIVREAISFLSPAERAALIMWEIEGRSTGEIARELGIRENAVRHTVSRARAGLRRILSERIIDEERGLTALDLLSVAYRKAGSVARKSSKAALSFVLVFVAFLSLNPLSPSDFSGREPRASLERAFDDNKVPLETNDSVKDLEDSQIDSEFVSEASSSSLAVKKSTDRSFSTNALESIFPGLDGEGVPTGSTVADSLGNLGLLFPGLPKRLSTETGWVLSGIVSTKSGATNLLLNQSIVVDAFGTAYVAEVSVGINGGWHLLRLAYVSSDVERLASGNYLIAAMMMVESAVETSVKVSTGTSGTDLSSAPEFVSTRLLLDPTKTKILAQAVLVSADSQGDGA
jgi:RNA polymerase sigma factor (sigma-70 family)